MSLLTAALPGLGWLLGTPFMRNAFLAGTLIALACGLVGYFLVLRAQVFTSDALGHVAFTAALGALAFGLDPRLGLFVGTILVALAMAALGRRASADDVVIGSTFAWVLGLGVLFLTLYTTRHSTANGVASVNYLFGSIFGLSTVQAASAALIGAAICGAVLVIARPLLFASLDEAVAAAAGVPVRLLGVVFLVLVAATTAEATQAVGALLVLGLVAAPAGAAQQLTVRPFVALGLSVAFSVGAMWIGLTVAYLAPQLPPSFAIISVATATYVAAMLWAWAMRARPADRAVGSGEATTG